MTLLRPPFSETGLYLHIPFCHARCGYCDFVTFTGKDDQVDRYCSALVSELDLLSAKYPSRPPLKSVFFGGGTPSVLSAPQITRILDAIRSHWTVDSAEITIEANPESTTDVLARAWASAGVTRVSLGLQSMDDRRLAAIGRLHDADGFRRAFAAVRSAGFDNVNADLIYGFEGQSRAEWETTLDETIALAPEHLSLYALTVEPHTPFAAQGHRTDDDAQADLYQVARDRLERSGYRQYEISNFARGGRSCEHNLLYWRQQNYLAAGVGAVGCVSGLRWQNTKTLGAYFDAIQAGRLPWESTEEIDGDVRRFERLMLGLRLREGFEWGDEPDEQWQKERRRLSDKGLLEELRPGVWRIPDSAVALTNQVLLSFLKGPAIAPS